MRPKQNTHLVHISVLNNSIHAMPNSKHTSTWFLPHRETPRFSVRSAMTIIVLFGGVYGAHGQDSAGKEVVQNLDKNPILLPTEPPRPKFLISAQVDYS